MDNKVIEEVFNQYFNGDKNFVTPHVYGYDSIFITKENILLIEKSRNNESTLYGATVLVFNPMDNTCSRVELGDCFESSAKLRKYISNITEEDFNNALKYGECKKIIL